LEVCKSTGTDPHPTELMEAGNKTICSEIHKLFALFAIRENFPSEGRDVFYLFNRKVIKLTGVIIEAYHC
jgi:hypothetical protein